MKYRLNKGARVHSRPELDSQTIIELDSGTVIEGKVVDKFIEFKALVVFGEPMIGYVSEKLVDKVKKEVEV